MSNSVPGAFAKRLEYFRKMRGLSYQKFADIAGHNVGNVFGYCKGKKRHPEVLTLKDFVDALRLDEAQRAQLFEALLQDLEEEDQTNRVA